MIKASLSNYRQSPRKVRLVADLIRGKNVNEALVELDFLAKRAGEPIKKLILSAVANAKGANTENLFVESIRVDKGIVLKRMMPRARGSGFPIKKRSSHVEVVLIEKMPKESKKKEVKKVTKKSTAKSK